MTRKKTTRARASSAPEVSHRHGHEFDAEKAFQSLSRDVARLADAIHAAQAGRSVPAPRAVRARSRGTRSLGPDRGLLEALRILREYHNEWDIPFSTVPIVGGVRAVASEFPSCSCIGNNSGFYSSAVLVRPRVLLTAAHSTEEHELSRAYVNGDDIDSLIGELLEISEVVSHPRYNSTGNHENDIAVLILAQSAETAPVELVSPTDLSSATACEVVGFGYSDPNYKIGFGAKRRVEVPIAAIERGPSDDLRELAERLGFDPEFEFVAGRKYLGRDSCRGDSGGPAYLGTAARHKLLGITSRPTLEAEHPDACGDGGVYVRPDRHEDWIRAVLKKRRISW